MKVLSSLAARFSAADLARRWSDLIGVVETSGYDRHTSDDDNWAEDRRRRHDPEIQRLCSLVCDWHPKFENEDKITPELHENLLAMHECASRWRSIHDPILYRAFLPTQAQSRALRDTGRCSLLTPLDRPLATWSRCLFGAFEWIADCPHPWMIFSQKTDDLDIFIDFGSFYGEFLADDTRYNDVIVEMPPTMTISRANIPLTRDIDWIAHTGPNPARRTRLDVVSAFVTVSRRSG